MRLLIFASLLSLLTTIMITPIVIYLAKKFRFVDIPEKRKIHQRIMPRLGGLSIFLGTAIGFIILKLYEYHIMYIVVGGIIILLLGIFDDKYQLKPRTKILVQVLVGVLLIFNGIKIESVFIPFFYEKITLGHFSYLYTIVWIVGVTNAINLIDGLDGLAAGISFISLLTIAIMANITGEEFIFSVALIISMSTLGFLKYNFYPAKIFMGDTGALFLGYVIAILSLLGMYKSVTLFSFIIPIIILGVPITDTTFAMIRRMVNKQSISEPDKAHIHHKLLSLGLSHKQSVLVLYGLSALFSSFALIIASSTMWISIIFIILFILVVQIIVEVVELINEKYKPFLNFYKKVILRVKK